MSCQVILNDSVRRDSINEMVGVEPVVDRTDVDVVDIQQNPAICFFSQGAEKICFGPSRRPEFQIGRRIFENQHRILDAMISTKYIYFGGNRYLEISVLGGKLKVIEKIDEKLSADLTWEYRQLVITICQ
jgi:hypothetical protein